MTDHPRNMSAKRKWPFLWLLASISVVGAIAGCDSGVTATILAADAARFAPTSIEAPTYDAVDQMLRQSPLLVNTGGPIIVGSIADIRDVNHTTPLGNTIAELVRSRLVQNRLVVTDLRLRSTVWMGHSEGELMLSRNRKELVPPPAAAEMVAGTYAVGSNTVYVSLKIIEAANAQIMAASDFSLPRTPDIEQLLIGTVASAR
jgi:hypothetical protein